jgi:23S rRNA pseudouridine1911/1915/1917 synthase
MTRQALHAFRLAFVHPVTGVPLAFHAPAPADLRAAWAFWGLRYNESEWLTSQAAAAASEGTSASPGPSGPATA